MAIYIYITEFSTADLDEQQDARRANDSAALTFNNVQNDPFLEVSMYLRKIPHDSEP